MLTFMKRNVINMLNVIHKQTIFKTLLLINVLEDFFLFYEIFMELVSRDDSIEHY